MDNLLLAVPLDFLHFPTLEHAMIETKRKATSSATGGSDHLHTSHGQRIASAELLITLLFSRPLLNASRANVQSPLHTSLGGTFSETE